MLLRLTEIAACLGLESCGQDVPISAAVTDSRDVTAGALFVCIRGERADGHDFAEQAENAGASAILAARRLPGITRPVLLVSDTVKALGRIASRWREQTRARVIGVTGTAGKTTLKELLAQLLASHGKTARNALNFNNQIGMPRSMLATDGDEDFWVMEAGISRQGDMEELGEILRPDLALILNVGAGHTEKLGQRGVAAHKAALLRYLASGGFGIVSADYPDIVREAAVTGAPLHFFSVKDPAARYYAVYEGPEERQGDSGELSAARGRYRLCLDNDRLCVTAPFHGEYGAENCIAAAAAAHLLGLSKNEITSGFAGAVLPPQRFMRQRLGEWESIDDTYNANPLSMRRMLDTARELARQRPFVPVLGEMLELGDSAAEEHEKLGVYLAGLTPAVIFWKGGHASDIRAGLNKGGYKGKFFTIRQRGEFTAILDNLVLNKNSGLAGGILLFKGSRGNRLEEEYRDFCARIGNGSDSAQTLPGENQHVL